MQAIADNLTETMETKAGEIQNPPDSMGEHTSLFSSDELIFQEEHDDKVKTRYGYKISNMNFLVPEGMGSEVIQNPNIFNLPNSPTWIVGLINIRGNIIPVMNIDKLLNKISDKKYSNILVLNKSDNQKAIAIMINDLPISLEHNDSTASSSNYPEQLLDFVSDGFSQQNNDWIEFSPQKLFEKLAGKLNP